MAHAAAAGILLLSEEEYTFSGGTQSQEQLLAQMRQMESAGLNDSGVRVVDDFDDLHPDMRGYDPHLKLPGGGSAQFFTGTSSGQFPTGSGMFGTGSGTFPTFGASGTFDTSIGMDESGTGGPGPAVPPPSAQQVPQTPSAYIASSYPQTPAASFAQHQQQQPSFAQQHHAQHHQQHQQQQQPHHAAGVPTSHFNQPAPTSPIEMSTQPPQKLARHSAHHSGASAGSSHPQTNGATQRQPPKQEIPQQQQQQPFFSPQSSLTMQTYPQTPASAPQTPQQPASPTSAHFPSSPFPASQASIAAVQLLQQIQSLDRQQREQMDRLWRQQNKVMQSPSKEAFNELDTEHKTLKHTLDQELMALNNLFDRVMLEPVDLSRFYALKLDLEIQLKQLELLMVELSTLVQTPATPPSTVALVILKQPFPLVIAKNKQLAEDALSVQLLTASNVSFASISHVSATVICDAAQAKSGAKMIDMNTQALDPANRLAKFPLKFLSGTKKASVNIKFGMQIQLTNHPSTVSAESAASGPVVVITNECQWEGSAGVLLKKDAFHNGQLDIPWERFANMLQSMFIRATKQELAHPRRTLSSYDMNWIHSKHFGKKDLISQKDFDAFWDWFGKSMQKLRYQRHVCSMFLSGLLYGFMGRDEVNAALANQEPGTFIIRFSERHAGQFAIAYIGSDGSGQIKHYLMQPNDTAAAKKTLPDFLLEHPQFLSVLVFTNDAQGRPTFVKTPKAQVLETFVGKRDMAAASQNGLGYEPL